MSTAAEQSALLDEAVALAGTYATEEVAQQALLNAGWPADRDTMCGALSGGRLVQLAVSNAREACTGDGDPAGIYALSLAEAAKRTARGEQAVADNRRSRLDAASAVCARAAAQAVADLLDVPR